jgi:hypothetical protein
MHVSACGSLPFWCSMAACSIANRSGALAVLQAPHDFVDGLGREAPR